MTPISTPVVHEDEHKITINDESEIARLTYHLEKGAMQITGTYVDPTYRGKGLASKLTQKAIAYAKDNGLFIQPICPYVKSYFKRNPEEQNILVHTPNGN